MTIGPTNNTGPVIGARTVRAAMLGGGGGKDTGKGSISGGSDAQSISDILATIDDESSQNDPSKDIGTKDAAPSNPTSKTGSDDISSSTGPASWTPVSANPEAMLYPDPLGMIRDVGRTSQFGMIDRSRLIASLQGQGPLAIRMLGDLYMSREGENPALQNWALSMIDSLSNDSSSINALKDIYRDPRSTPALRSAVIQILQGIAIKDPASTIQVLNALNGMMKFKEDPEILKAMVTIGRSNMSAKFMSESALFSILRDTNISKGIRSSAITLLADSGAADRLKAYVAQIGVDADEVALAKECIGRLISLTTASRESGAAMRGILHSCLTETMGNASFNVKEKMAFLNAYYKADPDNAVVLIAKFSSDPDFNSEIENICMDYLKKAGSNPNVSMTILRIFEDTEVKPELREKLLTELMQIDPAPVVAYLKSKTGSQRALGILSFGLAHTSTRFEQLLGGKYSENFRVLVCAGFDTYCDSVNDVDGKKLVASLLDRHDPALENIIITSRSNNFLRAQYFRKAPSAVYKRGTNA